MSRGSNLEKDTLEYTAIRVAERRLGVQLQRMNFKANLRRELTEAGDDDTEDYIKEDFARIPDAWHIDSATGLVTVVEVEDTCPMSYDKMLDYAKLAGMLFDGISDFALRLIVVDRYGSPTAFNFTEWLSAAYMVRYGEAQFTESITVYGRADEDRFTGMLAFWVALPMVAPIVITDE